MDLNEKTGIDLIVNGRVKLQVPHEGTINHKIYLALLDGNDSMFGIAKKLNTYYSVVSQVRKRYLPELEKVVVGRAKQSAPKPGSQSALILSELVKGGPKVTRYAVAKELGVQFSTVDRVYKAYYLNMIK